MTDRYEDELQSLFDAERTELIVDSGRFVAGVERRIGQRQILRRCVLGAATAMSCVIAGLQLPDILTLLANYNGLVEVPSMTGFTEQVDIQANLAQPQLFGLILLVIGSVVAAVSLERV